MASASNVDVVLRRSGRKRRAAWQETFTMKIRASRAEGESDKIPVRSLGGRPSHKKGRKKRKSAEADVIKKKMPFCGECGHKHLSDDLKFCSNCGTKREDAAAQCSAAATAQSAAAQCSAAATAQSSAEEAEQCSAEEAEEADPVIMPSVGRPKNILTKLRCGWSIVEGSYIAPDGTSFKNRKKASQYHNQNIPKLEPARKDGWQVFVDSTNTHTHWICPDGQVLKSFIAAKHYAAKSCYPIWGKDGLTKTLSSFFGNKQDTSSCNVVVDLTSAAQSVTTPIPPRHQTQKSQSKNMLLQSTSKCFKIPRQTSEGLDLQKLLRQASVSRDMRKKSRATELEKQYHELFTFPKTRSNDMHNRVRHVCN